MKKFLLFFFAAIMFAGGVYAQCPTSLTVTTTNSTCGAANGTVTIGGVTGGMAPYTYSFNGSAYTATINYTIGAGTYSVAVKDANSCIYTTSVTVTNSPGPTAATATPQNATCGAANGVITVTGVTGGTSPYTYAINGGTFQTSNVFNGLAANTYTIKVKDNNGCVFTMSPATVVGNSGGATSATATASNATCGSSNGSISVSGVTGGSAPYTYSISGTGGTYQTGNMFNGLPAGSYPVSVKDNNGCVYTITPNTTVGNSGGPTTPTAANNGPVCEGTTLSLSTPTVSGATYTWTGPLGYNSNQQNPTVSTSATPAMSGTYSVTVTVSGCTSGAGTTTVTVNPKPSINTTPSNTTICAGSMVVSTNLSSTPGGAMYAWTNSNTAIGLPGSGTGNIPSFTATNSTSSPITGTITITPSLNGCSGNSVVYVITVNPTPFMTSAPSATICSGNTITIPLTSNVASTYSWVAADNPNTTGESTTPQAGSTLTNTITNTSAVAQNVIYTVTPTSVGGCSGLAQTVTVTVNPCSGGPTAVATNITNASCGNSNGSLTIGAVTGGTSPYTYNFNNGGFSTQTSYINLAAGTYALAVKDAGGNVYTTTVAITTSNGPTALAVSSTNAGCNSGGTVTIGGTTGGVAPYTFSFNGSSFTPNASYSGVTAGSYSVSVKDNNGCIFTTSITVSGSASLTATANTTSTSCPTATNGSVNISVLTGAPPYQYSIDNGNSWQSSNTFTNLAAGQYSLLIRNGSGCTGTVNAVIEAGTAGYNYGGGTGFPEGYFFANSTPCSAPSPAQTPYSWITEQSNEVTAWLPNANDGVFGPINLPFSFPYFNGNYSQCWITSNGAITFNNPALLSASQLKTPVAIPTAGGIENYIAACMTDLDVTTAAYPDAHVYYGGNASRFVITFLHAHKAGSADYITFQVILKSDGTVVCQYNNTETTSPVPLSITNSCSVGIENTDGSSGVQYRLNGIGGPMFGSPLAITFMPKYLLAGASSEGITAFPNPVKNLLRVNFNAAKTDNGTLTITDMSGKRLYSQNVNAVKGVNSIPVNTERFSGGTYIIKIQLSDNTMVRKFNKM